MIGAVRPYRTRMRIVAWGRTSADVDLAVRMAGQGRSRYGWTFERVEVLGGLHCPIDEEDPSQIAVEIEKQWAYAVYPADDELLYRLVPR